MPVSIFLLVLITMPFIEIAVFIKVGSAIGIGNTILLVVSLLILGGILLREQGFRAFANMQAALQRGETPVDEVVNGFLLLLAAVLTLLPGLVTSVLGILLLVPPLRRFAGKGLRRWAATKVQTRQTQSKDGSFTIIEGEAVEVDPQDRPGGNGEPPRKLPPQG